MVPQIYIFLESLPLTVTGKVDRKALPAPQESDIPQNTYVAPRNEVEASLCQLWQDILQAEQVGIEDNFFELGGDSITSMLMVSKARKIGLSISVRTVFVDQSIRSMFDNNSVETLKKGNDDDAFDVERGNKNFNSTRAYASMKAFASEEDLDLHGMEI